MLLGEHPGAGGAGRVVLLWPVVVAAADEDQVVTPGLRPRQGRPPGAVPPARVPDLGRAGALGERVPPRAVGGQGMVDRQQAAPLPYGSRPGVRGLAEVDPAEVAEGVRVAEVGRDLLTGDQRDPGGRGHPGQFGVVADGVVVGDGQEVQALGAGQDRELGHGQGAVGVHGVGVQLPGPPAPAVQLRKPPQCRGGHDGGGRSGRPGQGRGAGAGRGSGVGGDGELVRQARERDAVEPEQPPPDARLGLSGQVAGRGPPGRDRVAGTRAARPAAEARRALAPEVEHARRAVVGQLHGERAGAGRELDGHRVDLLGQPVVEGPPPAHPDRRGHGAHGTTSSPSR